MALQHVIEQICRVTLESHDGGQEEELEGLLSFLKQCSPESRKEAGTDTIWTYVDALDPKLHSLGYLYLL